MSPNTMDEFVAAAEALEAEWAVVADYMNDWIREWEAMKPRRARAVEMELGPARDREEQRIHAAVRELLDRRDSITAQQKAINDRRMALKAKFAEVHPTTRARLRPSPN